MENASKALIIAGAILLAILIISLGIMIYNQAAGVVNNNAMSEVEVTQFNAKFTQYEGDSVSGSVVKSMLQVVLQHNIAQDSDDRRVAVTGAITLANDAKKLDGITVPNGNTYEVKCTYTKGLVSGITVTKNQ